MVLRHDQSQDGHPFKAAVPFCGASSDEPFMSRREGPIFSSATTRNEDGALLKPYAPHTREALQPGDHHKDIPSKSEKDGTLPSSDLLIEPFYSWSYTGKMTDCTEDSITCYTWPHSTERRIRRMTIQSTVLATNSPITLVGSNFVGGAETPNGFECRESLLVPSITNVL